MCGNLYLGQIVYKYWGKHYQIFEFLSFRRLRPRATFISDDLIHDPDNYLQIIAFLAP